jgi:hypothetical protein
MGRTSLAGSRLSSLPMLLPQAVEAARRRISENRARGTATSARLGTRRRGRGTQSWRQRGAWPRRVKSGRSVCPPAKVAGSAVRALSRRAGLGAAAYPPLVPPMISRNRSCHAPVSPLFTASLINAISVDSTSARTRPSSFLTLS